MKLAIINYGMGNLGSVSRAFEHLGVTVLLVDQPEALYDVDRIVLPGVGSFAEGMLRLRSGGWESVLRKVVVENKKPLLGICLGMQLLASKGEEGGVIEGLDLISGQVLRLDKLGCDQRIPHVGWNDINLKIKSPLFSGIESGTDFYFVHSYAFEAAQSDFVNATVDCGVGISASISSQHIFGVQFHPEKSSKAGRQLLQNFLEYRSC